MGIGRGILNVIDKLVIDAIVILRKEVGQLSRTSGAVGNIGQDFKGVDNEPLWVLFWILTEIGEYKISKISMCLGVNKLIREMHSSLPHALQTGQ
mmetsp:Transcript_17137/g.26916  ORF Transcript_17137/g.26916 Transcript_17137/m.26916 type:complete len:95 (-) Transcript_17137:253-537(-)